MTLSKFLVGHRAGPADGFLRVSMFVPRPVRGLRSLFFPGCLSSFSPPRRLFFFEGPR